MKFLFLLTTVIPFSLALAADPLDVLLRRSATIVERRNAALALEVSGKEKPLSYADSIAELCYGVDLCAQKATDDELNEACSDSSNDQEEYDSSEPCSVKKFRETHSCSDEVKKQTLDTVLMTQKAVSDVNSVYISKMFSAIDTYFKTNLGIDAVGMGPGAFEEYVKKKPELKDLLDGIPALGQYTMDCYSKLNPMLFASDKTKALRHFNFIRGLIDSMSILPDFKGKVNRGVNLPPEVLKEHHKVGNVICYKAFTSTAIHHPSDMGDKPRNYFLDGKCTQRLYINYQAGAKPGKLIGDSSVSTSENEVLFEPGACFRIDKVYPRTDKPSEDDADEVCQEGERYNFEMTLVR